MKMERINDITLKFTFTLEELHERGIDRNQFWCQKDKGEVLIEDMLEEAYVYEEFEADGPIWIETRVLDVVVEVFLTKGGKELIFPLSENDLAQIGLKTSDKEGGPLKMNHDMFSSKLQNKTVVTEKNVQGIQTGYHASVYKFKDFEYIIQLAQRLRLPFYDCKLYSFNNGYYLVVQYPESKAIRNKDMIENIILEYGDRAYTSLHRLEEYGKVIMDSNAIAQVKTYFKV
jgi:adapter protein MecA 1/2